jgi:glycolate oxidase FAD binding subunit
MSTAAFIIDGHTPRDVVIPASIDELARCTIAAHAANQAVIPVGNGTQLHIGRPPARYDLALSTRRLARILAHEPADMTVTVEAGITLAELNAALAAAGQRLPLDPAHPERTTIGALIATDASGPLRLSHGKVRDLLIGITVVLADGTRAHGGGRVVKNVAGYDLMKLFSGSFGTLGIIVEATFKVRPVPEHESVVVSPTTALADAVTLAIGLLNAPLAPLYVEALNRAGAACLGLDGPAVIVGCGGTAEEISAQCQRLENHVGRDAARLSPLAARPLGARNGDGAWGCKVSVLPSQLGAVLARIEAEAAQHDLEAATVSHVGSGIAIIRFNTAADDQLPAFAEWLRTTVRAVGGWTVFDLLPTRLKDRIDPWGTDPPGIRLMRGIKQTLDPSACLSPGRFLEGR